MLLSTEIYSLERIDSQWLPILNDDGRMLRSPRTDRHEETGITKYSEK